MFNWTKHNIFLTVILCETNLLSCKNETIAEFNIVNATNDKVDSLYILPDKSKGNILHLEPNSASSYNINMTDLPKVDGSFRLSFKLKNKKRIIPFGYYTNGYPLESSTKIEIHNDTVLIKPEYKNN